MISKKWIVQRRNELLSKTSDAEKAAYRHIQRLGYEVVRQYPIDTGRHIYFADLYVPALRLVMEIDGGYHYTDKQRRLDNNRSSGMWRKRYHVCRLSNADARNINKIRAKINRFIDRNKPKHDIRCC